MHSSYTALVNCSEAVNEGKRKSNVGQLLTYSQDRDEDSCPVSQSQSHTTLCLSICQSVSWLSINRMT